MTFKELLQYKKKQLELYKNNPNINILIKKYINVLKNRNDIDCGIDDEGNNKEKVCKIKFNNYMQLVFFEEWTENLLKNSV